MPFKSSKDANMQNYQANKQHDENEQTESASEADERRNQQ